MESNCSERKVSCKDTVIGPCMKQLQSESLKACIVLVFGYFKRLHAESVSIGRWINSCGYFIIPVILGGFFKNIYFQWVCVCVCVCVFLCVCFLFFRISNQIVLWTLRMTSRKVKITSDYVMGKQERTFSFVILFLNYSPHIRRYFWLTMLRISMNLKAMLWIVIHDKNTESLLKSQEDRNLTT